MLYIKTCEYNIDSGYLEAEDVFGNKYSVDVCAVEYEYADNMYDRSALDYLLYNKPVEFLNLLLSGELPEYINSHHFRLED